MTFHEHYWKEEATMGIIIAERSVNMGKVAKRWGLPIPYNLMLAFAIWCLKYCIEMSHVIPSDSRQLNWKISERYKKEAK